MVALDKALLGSHSPALYSLVLSLQIWQLNTSRNFKIDKCNTFIIAYRHVQSKENPFGSAPPQYLLTHSPEGTDNEADGRERWEAKTPRDISAGGRREGWLKPLGENPKSLNRGVPSHEENNLASRQGVK